MTTAQIGGEFTLAELDIPASEEAPAQRPRRNRKSVGEWLRNVTWAVVLVAVTAASLVPLHLKAEDRLMWNVVETGSMEPTLPVGSIIVSVPTETIEVGQIVVARRGEHPKPIVHRVLEINEAAGTFTMQGDANPAPDARPYDLDEAWELVAVIPTGGELFAKVQNDPLLAIATGAAGATLLTLAIAPSVQASLTRRRWRGDLSQMSFANQDLREADFSRTILDGTLLEGASLLGADLSRSQLGKQLRIAGCDLRGADLSRSRMGRRRVTAERLTAAGAIVDGSTTYGTK